MGWKASPKTSRITKQKNIDKVASSEQGRTGGQKRDRSDTSTPDKEKTKRTKDARAASLGSTGYTSNVDPDETEPVATCSYALKVNNIGVTIVPIDYPNNYLFTTEQRDLIKTTQKTGRTRRRTTFTQFFRS